MVVRNTSHEFQIILANILSNKQRWTENQGDYYNKIAIVPHYPFK